MYWYGRTRPPRVDCCPGLICSGKIGASGGRTYGEVTRDTTRKIAFLSRIPGKRQRAGAWPGQPRTADNRARPAHPRPGGGSQLGILSSQRPTRLDICAAPYSEKVTATIARESRACLPDTAAATAWSRGYCWLWRSGLVVLGANAMGTGER